jgi:hypothetical protein
MLPHHIESKKDMETKQSRMHEYMTRREFYRKMKFISKINMGSKKRKNSIRDCWKKECTAVPVK